MRVSPVNKRDEFPTTPKTTHFAQHPGGKITVSLGGTHLGTVVKRDGFYVSTFMWGEEITAKSEHTLENLDKKGNLISTEHVPVGTYLKTVRDALMQRFFPTPTPANAPHVGG